MKTIQRFGSEHFDPYKNFFKWCKPIYYDENYLRTFSILVRVDQTEEYFAIKTFRKDFFIDEKDKINKNKI